MATAAVAAADGQHAQADSARRPRALGRLAPGGLEHHALEAHDLEREASPCNRHAGGPFDHQAAAHSLIAVLPPPERTHWTMGSTQGLSAPRCPSRRTGIGTMRLMKALWACAQNNYTTQSFGAAATTMQREFVRQPRRSAAGRDPIVGRGPRRPGRDPQRP